MIIKKKLSLVFVSFISSLQRDKKLTKNCVWDFCLNLHDHTRFYLTYLRFFYFRTVVKHHVSETMFGNVAAAAAVFLKNLNFFFIKIKYNLYVLDCFDVLMSKIIFKK
jgi:hypothetical protein